MVGIDQRQFRSAEVATLLGDAIKAGSQRGWTRTTPFEKWVSEMVSEDFEPVKRDVMSEGEVSCAYSISFCLHTIAN